MFGGAGKDPTLVVFRTVLPGVGNEDPRGGVAAPVVLVLDIDVVLSVGIAGVEWVFTGLGVGRLEVVTDRDNGLFEGAAIEDAAEVGRESDASGMSGRGFLVLATGRAGRGALGGAVGGGLIFEGRCGIADVMVAVAVRDIACYAQGGVCNCTSPSVAASVRRRRSRAAAGRWWWCGTALLLPHRHVLHPAARRRTIPPDINAELYPFENVVRRGSGGVVTKRTSSS